jgi:hypothetical protein
MRFLRSLIPSLLLLGAGVAEASSSWSFEEGSISVGSKSGHALEHKYVSFKLESRQQLLRYVVNINWQVLAQIRSQGPSRIGPNR